MENETQELKVLLEKSLTKNEIVYTIKPECNEYDTLLGWDIFITYPGTSGETNEIVIEFDDLKYYIRIPNFCTGLFDEYKALRACNHVNKYLVNGKIIYNEESKEASFFISDVLTDDNKRNLDEIMSFLSFATSITEEGHDFLMREYQENE